ncbi:MULTISPECIES: expansin EXLX1 family cellulose-binding protein [unclassified Nocardia]|uniref:expansin EXLX1 family cellulose-binding protein n=1 Tax=unclassified Nocardia TaxID=2637762 RepID=UPI001CE49D12|nr:MULTISPECIES: expansin EXLX1 family cellulose-binding protein [unclassified Nocardia]
MHRIPIQQRHFRSVWLWSALGIVLVAAAVVWLTRSEPNACDTGVVADVSASTRMPLPVTAFPDTPSTVPAPVTTPPPEPQQVVAGEARFYNFTPNVACSFPGLPLDGFYVGMSTPEYGRAEPCGGYLDIHGPLGDVRAFIVDRCPGCAPGQLDLSIAAFDQIANRAAGVAKVTYAVVRDPQPPEELSYAVKPDSSPQWFAVLLTGTGNPLREVVIRTASGGDWRPLTHGMDNYWTISRPGPGPFALRVTDIHGHRTEVAGVTLDAGLRVTGAHLYDTPPPSIPVAPPITSPTALAVPHPPSVARSPNCK